MIELNVFDMPSDNDLDISDNELDTYIEKELKKPSLTMPRFVS